MATDPSAHRWTLADTLLLLTVSVWAVNFSVVKLALSEIPPLAFNSVRFLVAGLVVVVAAHATGHRWRFERRHLPGLVALGIVGNSLYQMLFIFGADRTTADNAALILATVPVWVALLGTLAGVERVRAPGWLGVGLSLLGIVLIVLGGDRGASFQFGGATLRGDGLILLCTLCWSSYTLLCRPAIRRYGVMAVTSFCVMVGAVPLILAGLPELTRLDRPVSPGAWAATVFSGALSIGLAYFLWNTGVSRLGSARTALFANLTPPIALATAWLVLGETLTLQQACGAALAVAGVVLARRHAAPIED